MGQQRRRPAAYFEMNALRGVPLNRVHNMVSDVERRMGRVAAGRIEFAEPHDDGRYFITFYNRNAADLFERLYRQTGRMPRRLTRLPEGVVIVPIEDAILAVIMGSVDEFIQHMLRRPGLN